MKSDSILILSMIALSINCNHKNRSKIHRKKTIPFPLGYLCYTILCCFFFISCQEENGIYQGTPLNEISFSSEVYISRASQTTKDNIETMGVIAYNSGESMFDSWSNENNGPNFMVNQPMTKENDIWTYSPKKYWPKGESPKLTFFAYSPYNKEDSYIKINNHTIDYTTPSNASDQIDLLAATPKIDVTQSVSADGIKFSFNHILSCIKFYYQGTKELKEITLSGIYTKGFYDMKSESWTLSDKTSITCTLSEYAMLLPQNGICKVKLTFNDDTSKEITIDGINWEKGKQYRYLLKE